MLRELLFWSHYNKHIVTGGVIIPGVLDIVLHRYLLTSSRESFSAGSRTDQGVILGRCYIPLTGVQSFEHFEYSLSWESTTFDFCCLQNTFPCIHVLNFENFSAYWKAPLHYSEIGGCTNLVCTAKRDERECELISFTFLN